MAVEVVGKPIDRVDGRLKVTGGARYAADFPIKGLTYGWIVQSTVSSGKIKSIDTAAAEKAPGVIAVITHLNAPKLAGVGGGFRSGGSPAESRMPLSDEKVHHAGQHIAVVVAESLEAARHGAGLVKVTYDEVGKGLPTLHDEMNAAQEGTEWFGEQLQYKRGDVDAGLEAARKEGAVVEATYETPDETHSPMEPSATIAHFEGDKLTVYDATQWIVGTQGVIVDAFGFSKDDVHVLSPFVGGGFGCKGFIWPHTILCVMAAKATGRPVKLCLTRAQMFTSCGHRPQTIQKIAIGAAKDGTLSAIRHETTTCTSKVSDYVEAAGNSSSRMVYKCENVATPHKIAKRHTPSPTFMRAPGETPGMYALECAMDELAYALKMDPVKLRQMNIPDVHPVGNRPWSTMNLDECYTVGAERFGWSKRAAEPRAMKDGNTLIGYGMATASFPGVRFGAQARVRVFADGKVSAGSSTHDLGTGAYTVFTQITADAMGVPIDRVTFELGDSSLPKGPLAGGSNSTATVSQAIVDAAAALAKKLAELAVADDASPLKGMTADDIDFVDGKLVSKADASKSDTPTDIVKRSGKPFVEAVASGSVNPDARKYAFHSFGAHFVEVRVDESLGRVRVERVFSAMDIGRVINTKLATSQIQGGVVMGIGMALLEASIYDGRSGRLVNDSFADYAVPVNADIRSLDVYFVNKPDTKFNKLGCRGVGEIGITGIAAAVANAIYHATGKRVRSLPITPDTLLG